MFVTQVRGSQPPGSLASNPPRTICVSIMRALATPPHLAGEPRQLRAGEAEAREEADRWGGAWESRGAGHSWGHGAACHGLSLPGDAEQKPRIPPLREAHSPSCGHKTHTIRLMGLPSFLSHSGWTPPRLSRVPTRSRAYARLGCLPPASQRTRPSAGHLALTHRHP